MPNVAFLVATEGSSNAIAGVPSSLTFESKEMSLISCDWQILIRVKSRPICLILRLILLCTKLYEISKTVKIDYVSNTQFLKP